VPPAVYGNFAYRTTTLTMRDPRYDTRRVPAEQVPPLWIRARDSQGRPIDPRVVAVSERIWPWAYRHVQRELRDSASAAQLVEGVALKVSSRLHAEPGVAQNLAGYFITAFHRQVHRQLVRENRLSYEGLLRELERNHRLTGPDWEAVIEWELCLQIVVGLLHDQPRRMLNYRILGFTWSEIGRALRISEKQARSRFYYALDRLHARLHRSRAKGADHSKEPD
jgi:DNA-directed RNA polymerase specialized sigma24 family protein